MSKLAHSNDETMAIIERKAAIAAIGRKVVTSNVCPPIPIRSHDWCAYFDGDEESGLRGWGATETDAIDDLLEVYHS